MYYTVACMAKATWSSVAVGHDRVHASCSSLYISATICEVPVHSVRSGSVQLSPSSFTRGSSRSAAADHWRSSEGFAYADVLRRQARKRTS
jgi:hypothetical protein